MKTSEWERDKVNVVRFVLCFFTALHFRGILYFSPLHLSDRFYYRYNLTNKTHDHLMKYDALPSSAAKYMRYCS